MKIEHTAVNFNGKEVRLVLAIDVTKELNIQNALRDTNSRLKLASEIARLGYWTNNFLTHEIQWSDELFKIFELDRDTFELTFENVTKCFHPDEQINFADDFHVFFDENEIRETESRIITGTGKVKWILERQYLIKDDNGKLVGMEGIAVDITERKLYEQSIVESNERFNLLARATVEAIIDWDIKNDKVLWGEAFQTNFGYDLSVYDNYLWSRNIHPDDKERVLNELSLTLQDPTQEHFNSEFIFLKANGDYAYVQHRALLIRDSSGRAVRALGAMIDITESLERMRRIEEQNRALTEIAWTQSHVIRAPLANLMGLVDILESNMAAGLSQGDITGHISDSARQLDLLIHDIIKKAANR